MEIDAGVVADGMSGQAAGFDAGAEVAGGEKAMLGRRAFEDDIAAFGDDIGDIAAELEGIAIPCSAWMRMVRPSRGEPSQSGWVRSRRMGTDLLAGLRRHSYSAQPARIAANQEGDGQAEMRFGEVGLQGDGLSEGVVGGVELADQSRGRCRAGEESGRRRAESRGVHKCGKSEVWLKAIRDGSGRD